MPESDELAFYLWGLALVWYVVFCHLTIKALVEWWPK